MTLTLEEIRQKGVRALRKELGRAGMIRFLQQFEIGRGDYARERHAWVDRMSLEQLIGTAGARKAKRNSRSR